MTSNTISPPTAAELASDIYSIHSGDERALRDFLNNPLFTSKQSPDAQIGGNIIKSAVEGFGLAAMGAGRFKGDLFLIFRGTEFTNKDDWPTNGGIGLINSKHIGFSNRFDSMRDQIDQFARG